jgi:transposase-like protein
MVLAPLVAGLFKWRQFEPKVILLAVGWYLPFSLEEPWRRGSARRSRHGVAMAMSRKWNDVCVGRLKPTNDSWRVDETYVRVKGKLLDIVY